MSEVASADRIRDPWGARTAYGPGERWPVRVDTQLAPGVSEADVERWVQSASVLHSNGDALDIAVKDGRIVGVRGRAVDRVNLGRLDIKDLYGWQAIGAPDRLRTPLVRDGDRLVETDWDTAMGRIVDRSRRLLAGPAGGDAMGSTPAVSCSSRSTTRSRSSGRPASARPTWTATPGCARRPPPRP
jgi:anaerobic selenocysteine-containing dehydrogenase